MSNSTENDNGRYYEYLITEFLWHGDDYEIKDITDPTGSNTDQYKLFLDTVHNEADRILHELSRKGIIL